MTRIRQGITRSVIIATILFTLLGCGGSEAQPTPEVTPESTPYPIEEIAPSPEVAPESTPYPLEEIAPSPVDGMVTEPYPYPAPVEVNPEGSTQGGAYPAQEMPTTAP